MNAGQLRHQVELQQPTWTGSGPSASTSWATYATVTARVRTLASRERLAAQAVGATMTCEIWLHYRDDVEPSHRVMFGARIFAINGVRNLDERNQWLILSCTEVL